MATTYRTPITIDSLVTHGCAVCRITHEDLTDADTSQTLTLATLAVGRGESAIPANSRPMFAWVNVLVPFAGGGNTEVTIALGDAGDIDELISAVSVFTGASGILPKTGTYSLGAFEAAYAPIATFTTTTGTCAGLTAGILEIVIVYQQILTDSVTG